MEHRFRRRASNFRERASCRDIRMPRRLLHKSWTPRMHGRRARRTLEVTEAGQRPTEALLAKVFTKDFSCWLKRASEADQSDHIALNLGPHRL